MQDELRFNAKCIQALASAIKHCNGESYESKGITVSEQFIRNPTSFVDHMAIQQGARHAVRLGLTLRRKNLKKGFESGNLAWMHQDAGIILGSTAAVTQLLEHLGLSEESAAG